MIWLLCIFTLLLSSCEQKPQETQYNEIVLQAQVPAAMDSTVSDRVSWTLPQGWKEEPAQGMRLASFHLMADPDLIDCYMTALAGPAGGLEANLERWLGQLGLQATDQNVNQLIISAQAFKTKDGLDVKVFDFTDLQAQGSPSDKSMLAAMITLDKTTVFVKMTGSVSAVKKNKDNYLRLLESMTRK